MKKITKLNNKGFTLIELLAVIVILAVVMAIAARSVLGVMNSSRKSALQDSAVAAARAFTNAYAEYSINQSGNVVGIGHDSLTASKVGLTTDSFNELAISTADYDQNNSFVYYDGNKFTVCLTATTTGSFYVASLATSSAKETGLTANNTPITLTGMWACSNGTHSW